MAFTDNLTPVQKQAFDFYTQLVNLFSQWGGAPSYTLARYATKFTRDPGVPSSGRDLGMVAAALKKAFESALPKVFGLSLGNPKFTTITEWNTRWLTLRAQVPGVLNSIGQNPDIFTTAMDNFYNKWVLPNLDKIPAVSTPQGGTYTGK